MTLSTSLEDIPRIRESLRAAFATGKTKPVAYRKEQLLQVAYMMKDNRDRFLEALSSDLGRPHNDSLLLEIGGSIEAAIKTYKNLDSWAKPEGIQFNFNFFAMKPRVFKVPKGTVLIVGPFNYPIWCTLNPLIGAIAAGCTIALKPSEQAPAVAALFTELFPKYLDPACYAIVNGSIPETSALLELQWDHIFFTGSERVGKVVATAAAKHLTPTTLELGGKNPAIVDKDCDYDATARRLLWGKTANAGQSCTAPDYAIVVREAHDRLVAALKKTYTDFFGDAPAPDQMSHIVNGATVHRLTGLLAESKGRIILGGQSDEKHNWIATTVVDGCVPGDSLLDGELFGPILPIMTVESVEEAVKFIAKKDHPLACYIFSQNQKVIDYVFSNTISGSVVANECVIQAGVYGLPFGGTGTSGYGSTGGKYSFDTFTHLRGSLHSPGWVERMLAMRYPPHTQAKLKQIQKSVEPAIPFPRPGTEQTPWGRLLFAVAAMLGIAVAGGSAKKNSK